MHQPSYRTADGEYQQPWVYLHAMKDYADMAWHLEQAPGARAVINFTPVLLEQLRDYERQFATGAFRDPLLRALRQGDADEPALRARLAHRLTRANEARVVARFPDFERLYSLAGDEASGGAPLSAADRSDALVWYHLAWLGEGSRGDERVARLAAKRRGFDEADRAGLLAVIGEIVAGIIPRYRALSHAGRIELSTSPYAHPMLPLLIEFKAALEAQPGADMPGAAEYAGGTPRAEIQLHEGKEYHARAFGAMPTGCWPPEGGVSMATLAALAANGFVWAASGEAVLAHSLGVRRGEPGRRRAYLYTPYHVHTEAGTITCFFRDDELSDRVGFVYSSWRADDAAEDLIGALAGIAAATAGEAAPVATLALDGENAWEYYEDNGRAFLDALYERLSGHPHLRLTTFSEHLKAAPSLPSLDRIVAGSWVGGTFATWIGDRDKNHGWDLLAAAKRAYDGAAASGRLDEQARRSAEAALRACEASDWFWWLGGYNAAEPVSDFERLFRAHLRDLYAALGEAPPGDLDEAVSVGRGAPEHLGVMRASTTGDTA